MKTLETKAHIHQPESPQQEQAVSGDFLLDEQWVEPTLYRKTRAGGVAAGDGGNLGGSLEPPSGFPLAIYARMVAAFQQDFSTVQLYRDSPKASRLGVLAYAFGEEIHFAPGAWNPYTNSGGELLGHELAHVVQQRQGRVKSEGKWAGMGINTAPALEQEATQWAKKAMRGQRIGIGPLKSSPKAPVAQFHTHPISEKDIGIVRGFLNNEGKSREATEVNAAKAYGHLAQFLELDVQLSPFLKDYPDIGRDLIYQLQEGSEAQKRIKRLIPQPGVGVTHFGMLAIEELRTEMGVDRSLEEMVKDTMGMDLPEFLALLAEWTGENPYPVQGTTPVELVMQIEGMLAETATMDPKLRTLNLENLSALRELLVLDSLLDRIELNALQQQNSLPVFEESWFMDGVPMHPGLLQGEKPAAQDEMYWRGYNTGHVVLMKALEFGIIYGIGNAIVPGLGFVLGLAAVGMTPDYVMPDWLSKMISVTGYARATRSRIREKRAEIQAARKANLPVKQLREELKDLREEKSSTVLRLVTAYTKMAKDAEIKNLDLSIYQQYTWGDLMGIKFAPGATAERLYLSFQQKIFELEAASLPLESIALNNYIFADEGLVENTKFIVHILEEDGDAITPKTSNQDPVKGDISLQSDIDLRNLRIVSGGSTIAFGRLRIKGLNIGLKQDLGLKKDFHNTLATFIGTVFGEVLYAGFGLIGPIIFKMIDHFSGTNSSGDDLAKGLNAFPGNDFELTFGFEELEIEDFVMAGDRADYIESIKLGPTHLLAKTEPWTPERLAIACAEVNGYDGLQFDILESEAGVGMETLKRMGGDTPKLKALRAELAALNKLLPIAAGYREEQNLDDPRDKIPALEKEIREIEAINQDLFQILEMEKEYRDIRKKAYKKQLPSKKSKALKAKADDLYKRILNANKAKRLNVTFEANDFEMKGAKMVEDLIGTNLSDYLIDPNFRDLSAKKFKFETSMNAFGMKDTFARVESLKVPDIGTQKFMVGKPGDAWYLKADEGVQLENILVTAEVKFSDTPGEVIPEYVNLELLTIDFVECNALTIYLNGSDEFATQQDVITLPLTTLEKFALKNLKIDFSQSGMKMLGPSGNADKVSISAGALSTLNSTYSQEKGVTQAGDSMIRWVISLLLSGETAALLPALDQTGLNTYNGEMGYLIGEKIDIGLMRSGEMEYDAQKLITDGTFRWRNIGANGVEDSYSSVEANEVQADWVTGSFKDSKNLHVNADLKGKTTYRDGKGTTATTTNTLSGINVRRENGNTRVITTQIDGEVKLDQVRNGKESFSLDGNYQFKDLDIQHLVNQEEEFIRIEGYAENEAGIRKVEEMQVAGTISEKEAQESLNLLYARRAQLLKSGDKKTVTETFDKLTIKLKAPHIRVSDVFFRSADKKTAITPYGRKKDRNELFVEGLDLDVTVKFSPETFEIQSILLNHLNIAKIGAQDLHVSYGGKRYREKSLSAIEGFSLTRIYFDANFRPRILPGGGVKMGPTHLRQLVLDALHLDHVPIGSLSINRLVSKEKPEGNALRVQKGDVFDLTTGALIATGDGGGYDFSVKDFGTDAHYDTKGLKSTMHLDANTNIWGTYLDNGLLSVHLKMPGTLGISDMRYEFTDEKVVTDKEGKETKVKERWFMRSIDGNGVLIRNQTAHLHIKFPLKDGVPDLGAPESLKIIKLHTEELVAKGLEVDIPGMYLFIPPHLPTSIKDIEFNNFEYNFLNKAVQGKFSTGAVQADRIALAIEGQLSAVGSMHLGSFSYEKFKEGGYHMSAVDPELWLHEAPHYYRYDYFKDKGNFSGLKLGESGAKDYLQILQGGDDPSIPLFSAGEITVTKVPDADRVQGEYSNNVRIRIKNPVLSPITLTNQITTLKNEKKGYNPYVVQLEELTLAGAIEGDLEIDTSVLADHGQTPNQANRMSSTVIKATGPIIVREARAVMPSISPYADYANDLKLYEHEQPGQPERTLEELLNDPVLMPDDILFPDDGNDPSNDTLPEEVPIVPTGDFLITPMTKFEAELYPQLLVREEAGTITPPQLFRLLELERKARNEEWNEALTRAWMDPLGPTAEDQIFELEQARQRRKLQTAQNFAATKERRTRKYQFLEASAGSTIAVSMFGTNHVMEVVDFPGFPGIGIEDRNGYVNFHQFVRSLVDTMESNSMTVMMVEFILLALYSAAQNPRSVMGGIGGAMGTVTRMIKNREKGKQGLVNFIVEFLTEYAVSTFIDGEEKFVYLPEFIANLEMMSGAQQSVQNLTDEEILATFQTLAPMGDRLKYFKDLIYSDPMSDKVGFGLGVLTDIWWYVNNMDIRVHVDATIDFARLQNNEKGLLSFVHPNPDRSNDLMEFELDISFNQNAENGDHYFWPTKRWGPRITLRDLNVPAIHMPIRTWDDNKKLSSSTILKTSGITMDRLHIETQNLDSKDFNASMNNLQINDLEIRMANIPKPKKDK